MSQWETGESYWSAELWGREDSPAPAERSKRHKKNKDVVNKVSMLIYLYAHSRVHKLEEFPVQGECFPVPVL